MSISSAGVAYLILAVFFGGFSLGVIATVAVCVRKEDRHYSLSGSAPGAAARGARFLTRFGGAGPHFRPRGWELAMSEAVLAIVIAFFVIGIVVGIIAVVAMSAFRADRRRHPGGPPDSDPPGPGG